MIWRFAYYVSGNVIEPIGRDYLYSEWVNPIFTKDGDGIYIYYFVCNNKQYYSRIF